MVEGTRKSWWRGTCGRRKTTLKGHEGDTRETGTKDREVSNEITPSLKPIWTPDFPLLTDAAHEAQPSLFGH